MKNIKEWPEKERPREKLIRQGAETLSDAELLAILFGRGIKGMDGVSFSREILSKFGSLRGVLNQSIESFKSVRGLGTARGCMLLAVKEIGCRNLREKMMEQSYAKNPQAVTDYLIATMRDKKRECFKVLFLDKSLKIIKEKDLFYGTIDHATVYPREVVRSALELHATNLVLVHNHPSGRVEPSKEDCEMTEKIKAACQTVAVRILDHMIIGENKYYSFSEQKLL